VLLLPFSSPFVCSPHLEYGYHWKHGGNLKSRKQDLHGYHFAYGFLKRMAKHLNFVRHEAAGYQRMIGRTLNFLKGCYTKLLVITRPEAAAFPYKQLRQLVNGYQLVSGLCCKQSKTL
jgi:hypothetical protein